MKKIALATMFSLTAGAAFAAGPTQPVPEPVVEPEVVVEEETGSAGGVVVPLILVAVIVAAFSSD